MTCSYLNIATLNLLNDLTFWKERRSLIVSELRRSMPDVVALQEVSVQISNAHWIAEQLGGYEVYLCPKSNGLGAHEGLAILSRLPVEKHETLAFGQQGRVAQRAMLLKGGQRWVVANTHLYWSPFDDPIRRRHAHRLLAWLGDDLPTVLCGDFNSLPHYKALTHLRQRFASAHVVHHGREPDFTFPTPLKRGPGLRHSARRAALRLIGQVIDRRRSAWQGTVDYIFIDRGIHVLKCGVLFNKPAEHDSLLFPSDHYGLAASLALSSLDR